MSQPWLTAVVDEYQLISPAQWCQAFFIFLSSGVLAVAVTPPTARRHLLEYGARTASERREKEAYDDWFTRLIATLTAWGQVPHSWFRYFYTTSLACSLFWLAQYFTNGRLLGLLATKQIALTETRSSVAPGQVVLVWTMMVLQASRRIYEHATFIKPSKSKMWCVHWLLGLSFYLCMSVSLWIEGSRSIVNQNLTILDTNSYSTKTGGALLAYLFAWVNQYRCHRHLADLRKYSLPERGMFRYLICPHYTCECLLYLAMAVGGAPEGALFNKTLLCGLIFIVTNLGVTAAGTRDWYKKKFGEEAVKRRWSMIPFLF